MKKFFGEELFLSTDAARIIYDEIRSLPIIDYHNHLDQKMIAADAHFSDVGELWLAADHYKWRAMRMCGVDEKYITGNATYKEKFIKYAEILPKMAGNAVYYWTQMELAQVFGIYDALCKENAESIYDRANAVLKKLSVQKLLASFGVEYLATTDDPVDTLEHHGVYSGITVRPTFRPDKLYAFSDAYLDELAKSAGVDIDCLDSLLGAIEARLDYFCQNGCSISDHGFEKFPSEYATHDEAAELFCRRNTLSDSERERLFGFLLVWLCEQYHKRDMIMQIHFAAVRNNNPEMFKLCGADAGFDLISDEQSVKNLIKFFRQTPDSLRPKTVLYTLNDSNLSALTAVCGAFRNVRAGAAWWFNDTVEGIRRALKITAEYSALGTSYGMLTDSRSFSSYVRFDFFRRLLSDYLGRLVSEGEYDMASAIQIAKDISYNNIKEALNL